MGEVVQFKRPKLSEKHKGKELCRHGFHKWELLANKEFDVRQGRLVSVYRCVRCDARKVEAH